MIPIPPDILQKAAALIRAEHYQEARQILTDYLRQKPDSEYGWFLLSFAVTARDQQIDCLRRVLRINPNNTQAEARLDKLTGTSTPVSTSPPAEPPRSLPAQPPTKSLRSLPSAHRSPEDEVSPTEKSFRESFRVAPVSKGKTAEPLMLPRVLRNVLIGAIGLGVIVFLIVIALFIRDFQQRRTAEIAALATPVILLPPTWTPLPTATPVPTNTPRPTVTITPTPTFASPGATARAQMEEIQKQVLDLRGLELLNSVISYVTNHLRYEQEVRDKIFTESTLAELKREELSLHATGLISPTFNLTDYALQNLSTGVTGVYVPWDKAIYLFGLRFSGVERFVFAHEFDHALIDQSFPFDTQLGLYPTCKWDSQRCRAITALVEGDATFLEYQWWQKYASQEDYRDFWYFTPPNMPYTGQEPPPYLAEDFYFPYKYGQFFVETLYKTGGWDAVNEAYRNLPQSSEQILHPEKYLADEKPIPVQGQALEEKLNADWEVVTNDSLGEWMTYLILRYSAYKDAQLEEEIARSAAQGWGGDNYRVIHNPKTRETILAAQWIWDAQADAEEFRGALLTYQERRFKGKTFDNPAGICKDNGNEISCVLTKGSQVVWLVVPNLEILNTVIAKYPGFQ